MLTGMACRCESPECLIGSLGQQDGFRCQLQPCNRACLEIETFSMIADSSAACLQFSAIGSGSSYMWTIYDQCNGRASHFTPLATLIPVEATGNHDRPSDRPLRALCSCPRQDVLTNLLQCSYIMIHRTHSAALDRASFVRAVV